MHLSSKSLWSSAGAAVALGLLLLCSSCLSFGYGRNLTFAPVEPSAVLALRPGESDLGEVLARLGAPIYVWEGKSGEVVLAYGAQRERGWGVGLSIPVVDYYSVSLSYDDAAQKLQGYVLVFDPSLKLTLVQAGLLRNLGAAARRRPAPVEEEAPKPDGQPAPAAPAPK